MANGSWTASNEASFNFSSNAQRTIGWTSADASGMSIFPFVVRYDEVARGAVEHAMRCTVANSR